MTRWTVARVVVVIIIIIIIVVIISVIVVITASGPTFSTIDRTSLRLQAEQPPWRTVNSFPMTETMVVIVVFMLVIVVIVAIIMLVIVSFRVFVAAASFG